MSTKNRIRLSIPTRQHLAQFIRHLHGHPVYIIQMAQCRSRIHQVMFNEILGNSTDAYQLNYKKASFDAQLYVTIPRYLDKRSLPLNSNLPTFGGNIEVSNQSIININWHLHEYFEQTLCSYYQSHRQVLGVGVEKSIQLFYQQFGITEQMITADALTKITQRRRSALVHSS